MINNPPFRQVLSCLAWVRQIIYLCNLSSHHKGFKS
uniref:Uncharacterized protein n=1 Tax=Arundo donax TaxID=35708 RepID=A0A0A8YEW5_ARUDO